MLHKIRKKNNRDFKRIPILRKLLKGVNAVIDRAYDDKQVHQIARNFRDRWIPEPVRKLNERKMEFQRGLELKQLTVSSNQWLQKLQRILLTAKEEVPPRFSSPPGASLVSSTAPSTATGLPPPRFCRLNCPDVIIAHP
ncbi:hypothetical protein DITRI_Ditri05aG0115500 [Diplodiscus trichospermus]